MTLRVFGIIGLLVLLSCSGPDGSSSRFNPLNLFGEPDQGTAQTDNAATETTAVAEPKDGKTNIARIVAARLEYTQSGVIVRANGDPATLGYHSADLTPVNFGAADASGTVEFLFRVMKPVGERAAGTKLTREISVGTFIPNARLRRISAVTITGAENEITIRLR